VKARGTAVVAGRRLAREATGGDAASFIDLRAPGDLTLISTGPRVLEVEQGGRATVMLEIRRGPGSHMRVPASLANLPTFVRITNVGLSGVLVTETQDRGQIPIEVAPSAAPGEQLLIPVVRAETTGRNIEVAGEPILLRIVPARVTAARTGSLP
jgi:hypothetical protein